jgi:hypothetical protein
MARPTISDEQRKHLAEMIMRAIANLPEIDTPPQVMRLISPDDLPEEARAWLITVLAGKKQTSH